MSGETTWHRHPNAVGKARVWRRDDGVETDYQWFYMLPNNFGSIARTHAEAMYAVRGFFLDRWLRRFHGAEGIEKP